MKNALYALAAALVAFAVVLYCELVFRTTILTDALIFPTTLSSAMFLVAYSFAAKCRRQIRVPFKYLVLHALGGIVLMILVWWVTLFVVMYVGFPAHG